MHTFICIYTCNILIKYIHICEIKIITKIKINIYVKRCGKVDGCSMPCAPSWKNGLMYSGRFCHI